MPSRSSEQLLVATVASVRLPACPVRARSFVRNLSWEKQGLQLWLGSYMCNHYVVKGEVETAARVLLKATPSTGPGVGAGAARRRGLAAGSAVALRTSALASRR